MRPLLTRAELEDFDRRATERGVPSLLLMENAGRGATDVLSRLYPSASTRFVVVCGEGNNGGDGFVVARLLLTRGRDVIVALHGSVERLKPDARTNHDAFVGVGGRVTLAADAAALGPIVAAADVIVDGIFGTGLSRPITGATRDVVDCINAARGDKVALDLPSGLDADTGAVLGCVVDARHTIKFAHLSLGLATPNGVRHGGTVHVADIGVPPDFAADVVRSVWLVDACDVAGWLSVRDASANKYSAGSVAIIGGGPGKTGAALLAAEAALSAGAGLSTLVTWEESAPAAEARVKEVMVARLVASDLSASLARALDKKRALAIGPGLGTDPLAAKLVEDVVFGWEGPKVVDADAIGVFAGEPSRLTRARGHVILTPHAGELARLLGVTSAEIEADRFGFVRRAAHETGCTVLLKGTRTLVAHGARVLVNDRGTPALATGGSGDVLAGMIAAFVVSMPPAEAAIAAAHVHGLAAEAWANAHGGADRGMLAGQLSVEVPHVLARLGARHVVARTDEE